MVKSQLTFPSNVGSTGKDHAQSLLRYASKSHRLKEIWIFFTEKWRTIGVKTMKHGGTCGFYL